MLVVGHVFSPRRAGAAGHRARLDVARKTSRSGSFSADEDSCGGTAGIGAVEAEANAADKLLYIRLAEIGVGAARPRGRAVGALVDTAQEQVAVEGDRARICLAFRGPSHDSPFGSSGVGEVLHLDTWTREVAARRWAPDRERLTPSGARRVPVAWDVPALVPRGMFVSEA